jgi:hypothetical protein
MNVCERHNLEMSHDPKPYHFAHTFDSYNTVHVLQLVHNIIIRANLNSFPARENILITECIRGFHWPFATVCYFTRIFLGFRNTGWVDPSESSAGTRRLGRIHSGPLRTTNIPSFPWMRGLKSVWVHSSVSPLFIAYQYCLWLSDFPKRDFAPG